MDMREKILEVALEKDFLKLLCLWVKDDSDCLVGVPEALLLRLLRLTWIAGKGRSLQKQESKEQLKHLVSYPCKVFSNDIQYS